MVKLAKEALTGIEDGNLEDKYRWEQGFTLEAYTMGIPRNRAMLSCRSATRSSGRMTTRRTIYGFNILQTSRRPSARKCAAGWRRTCPPSR